MERSGCVCDRRMAIEREASTNDEKLQNGGLHIPCCESLYKNPQTTCLVMCTNSKLPWTELRDIGMFARRRMFENTRIFAARFQKLFSRWISRWWPRFLAQLLTTNLKQEDTKYNCLPGWPVHCSGPLYQIEQLTVKFKNTSPHNIAAMKNRPHQRTQPDCQLCSAHRNRLRFLLYFSWTIF